MSVDTTKIEYYNWNRLKISNRWISVKEKKTYKWVTNQRSGN